MQDGLALLRSQPDAMRIFRLANRAMLLSIARAGAVSNRQPGEQFRDIDIQTIAPDSIRWRPFQLAFFLLSLRGLWDPTHEDRDTVDLTNTNHWTLLFETKEGPVKPVLVKKITDKVRWRNFFETMSPWSFDYLVVFDRAAVNPNAENLVEKPITRLVMANGEGRIKMEW
jgi:hypothetical protein